MQALGLGLAAVMGAGGGKVLYGSRSENNPQSSSGRSTNMQHPTILSLPSQSEGGLGLSNLLFAGVLGAGAVMVLGGFQWLRRDDAVKRLQPKFKKLEKAALKQVRKADENSADRDQRLDRNSKLRMQKMQSEIVGENRGNFDMLSNQINCLTQIALQTLSTMAKPTTPGGEGMEEAAEREQQKILEFARRAQREADKFVDQDRIKSARSFHVSSLRAEIPGLSNPGGGEVKEEEELISIGPHKLVDQTEKPKKNKERHYMTTGLVSLGSLAILGSVYMIFSSGTSKQSH